MAQPTALSDTPGPQTTQTLEPTPVDPGALPAWHVDDLPQPAPFRARTLLTMIGPGLVLAGGAIGTGEWVMGPKAAATYGGALFFVVLLSILAQVVFNTEVMRYTLLTGEPIMTGFMRTRPGPKFWILIYLLLDFGSWWPSQAMLAAQILVVMWYKIGPGGTIDNQTVTLVSYFIFIICGILPLFGGKVYNTVCAIITSKVLITLFFMLFISLFFVSGAIWAQMWSALLDPTRLPVDTVTGERKIDWGLVSALVAYAGVGGMGNILASNFIREKGWGMGSKVGAIPSAFGGRQIKLSHIGTIARDNPENIARFKQWLKYLRADQYLFWACGSLVAMMLPSMVGLQYLRTRSLTDDWQWAAALARDFVEQTGYPLLGTCLLLLGLVIMIPGQFYTVDATARRWTDAIWSATRWARGMQQHKVKYIYYSFATLYISLGIIAYTFFPHLSATDMLKIAGATANLAITVCILHTLYVNHRFLPRSYRPGLFKSACLVLSAIFFFSIFCLVFNQRILPILRGWFT